MQILIINDISYISLRNKPLCNMFFFSFSKRQVMSNIRDSYQPRGHSDLVHGKERYMSRISSNSSMFFIAHSCIYKVVM
jgi:hypothetical protein